MTLQSPFRSAERQMIPRLGGPHRRTHNQEKLSPHDATPRACYKRSVIRFKF
jgi:hypothetical protein